MSTPEVFYQEFKKLNATTRKRWILMGGSKNEKKASIYQGLWMIEEFESKTFEEKIEKLKKKFDGRGLVGDNVIKEDDDVSLKEYFQNHDEKFDKELIDEAARCGAIKCFRFLKINGVKVDEKTVECACEGGNEEIIQICSEEEGVELSRGVSGALRGWKINVAKWLVEVKGIKGIMMNIKSVIKESQNWAGWRMFQEDIKVEELFDSIWMMVDMEGSGIFEGMPAQRLNELLLKIVNSKIAAEGVDALCRHGADPNLLRRDGQPVIWWAAQRGLTETVKVLLDHGADFHVKGNNRQTAIWRAVYNDHAETVKVLLEHGEDPNSKNDLGETLIMVAAWNDLTEIAKVLLEHGAGPTLEGRNGQLAISWAAWRGNTEIVKLLLEHGANLKRRNGQAVICESVGKGHAKTVKALLEHGADPNSKDFCGESLVLIASREGHTETVKVLLEHGADPNTTNYFGESGVMIASKKGHTEIVKVLLEHGAGELQ